VTNIRASTRTSSGKHFATTDETDTLNYRRLKRLASVCLKGRKSILVMLSAVLLSIGVAVFNSGNIVFPALLLEALVALDVLFIVLLLF
jgi:hypothetical protein